MSFLIGAINSVDCSNVTKYAGLSDVLNIIGNVIDIIKIVVPLLLIIFGSLDLGKTVVAGKEDEIKDAQKLLLKRAIAAVAVFLLGVAIKLLFGVFEVDIPDECLEVESNAFDQVVIYEEIA